MKLFVTFFWNKEEEVWNEEVKSQTQKRGLYTHRASGKHVRNSVAAQSRPAIVAHMTNTLLRDVR